MAHRSRVVRTIHKSDVKQYMNDSMVLGLVGSGGESGKRVENASHRPAVLFSLETLGYVLTPRTYPV